MKNKISIFIMLLLLMIMISGCANSMEQSDSFTSTVSASEDDDMPTLVVYIPYDNVPEKDMQLLEDEVSEITRKKLKVKVHFVRNTDEVDSMLAGNEQLDIIFTAKDDFNRYYIEDKLLVLDHLLEVYGQDIIEQMGMDTINLCRSSNNQLYGLPNNREYASGTNTYAFRKDILEKYHIDLSAIDSYEKLEDMFATIHKEEPDLIILASGGSTMLSFLSFSQLSFQAGVHMDYGRSDKIVNLYKSQEYLDEVKRIRKWYLNGYLDTSYSTSIESIFTRLKNNEIFGYTTKNKPGLEIQEEMKSGLDFELLQLGETAYGYNTVSDMNYCITSNSCSPELSMQLLNLFYSDPDIANLLSYGIEGIHYKKMKDGHITYIDKDSANPFASGCWATPNQFLGYIWEGNPLTLWDDIKSFNENAIKCCDLGFNFDISPVITEYYNSEEVYDEYKKMIENGYVNPEMAIKEMNEELDKAGIELVIKEQQRQYENWKKNVAKSVE